MRNRVTFSSCKGGKMNKERKEVPIRANRNYKDTLFRMIFGEPKSLLSLYNAINGTNYTDEEQLEIVTLENAIYMNMKNDLAFLVDCRLNLYEQQASVNPNMPLRNLFYVAKEYQSLVDRKSLYASNVIKIPTPSFVVFYNGVLEQPERKEMKLSDAFATPVEDPALELKVTQLNIKAGHNKELLDRCTILKEYSQYVERVQRYVQEKSLNEAVEQAVQECIKEGILSEFLSKNRAEAISVSIFEYDEAKELALLRQGERELGMQEGMQAGMQAGELKSKVTLIRKKSNKGLSAEKIAELLEESEESIREILEVMASNPTASDEEVALIIMRG